MAMHTVAIKMDGGLKCQCGEVLADLAALNEHNLVGYNSPSESAIRARRATSWEPFVEVARCSETTESVKCSRIGCHNAGNGRDCFSIIGETAKGLSVGWHDLREDEALLLRHHGGYVYYAYHCIKTC